MEPSGSALRVSVVLLVSLAFLASCAGGAQVTETGEPIAPEQPPTTIRPSLPPTSTVATAPEVQPSPGFDPDTVSFSRFDTGRMWTFDNPPVDYLRETYNLTPSQAWFQRARMGALRFAEYCSASFISPDGLILTNHHCARESITAVTREGESLDETGFVAGTRQDEREVEDLFVEQLIDLFDVTDRIEASVATAQTSAERAEARATAISRLEQQLTDERGGEAAGIRAQVVAFYSGAQYSAYIYRRFDDIRLVFAPEASVGFFGGEPDNFTYPRYTLDYTFFRAYGPDGNPLDTRNFYFPWSAEGSAPGELVFVVGNPGSTTRLQTVSELLFRRDVHEPAVLRLYDTRADIYEEFVSANPDHDDTPELQDTQFSLANARKAFGGHVEGLRDDYIIARRAAAERAFQQAILDDDDLRDQYGGVIDAIAANRVEARELANQTRAFLGMAPGSVVASNVLGRAIFAYGYGLTNNPALRRGALGVEEDRPDDLELALLQAKLDDFVVYFGEDDSAVQQILRGRSTEEAAREIFAASAFRSHEGTQQMIEAGNPSTSNDPAIVVARAIWPRFAHFQQRSSVLNASLNELRGHLGRARFAIYGHDVPPDASFTLRLNDGVVRGYEYNGTVAPPFTTFWGMYDRHFSHSGTELEEHFELSDRWLPVPDDLDLTTAYNFVSTNDIIGGNSGSPMLNRNLQVVGVAFDGNMESLPGDFIYLSERNRTVGVDSRGMIHALEVIYEADHLVSEILEAAAATIR